MKDKMMKGMMEGMMSKKPKGKMSEQEKMAKMQVLEEILALAEEAMGEGLDEGIKSQKMQKVMVAAPSKEKLMEGLEKAEDVVEGMPEMGMLEDEEEEEEDEA